ELAPYEAVVEEAARVKIAVVGHIPRKVGIARALDAHQASIEHLGGYFEYLQRADSPFVAALAEAAHSGATREQVSHLAGRTAELAKWVDEARIPELAARTVRAGSWSVPTLVTLKNMVPASERDAAWKRPEMRYASAGMREWWNAPGHGADDDPAARRRVIE